MSAHEVTDDSHAVPPCRLTGHSVATTLQRPAVRTLGLDQPSGFITEPSVIKRILDHIRNRNRASRAPPRIRPPVLGQPAASPA